LGHEVLRKAVAIPLHLLDKPPGFDAIEVSEILVEHHLPPATTKIRFSIAGAAISSGEFVFSVA
jgi:hypothetical protein